MLARQQQERGAALQAVAVAQSDRMGYLESKGYDAGTVEGMSQDEIDNLIDRNVASDQRAVAVAQSDRIEYLESRGYDADTVEGMSQAEIDNLIGANVASGQEIVQATVRHHDVSGGEGLRRGNR